MPSILQAASPDPQTPIAELTHRQGAHVRVRVVSREGTPYYIILVVVPRRRRRRCAGLYFCQGCVEAMRLDRCALVTRNCRGFQDLGARQFKVNT